MIEKQRLNLTVDADAAAILERLAKGRNKMGDYLSTLLINVDKGTPTEEMERMDKEGLRLMIQGLGGRVNMLEGEIALIQSKLATIVSQRPG